MSLVDGATLLRDEDAIARFERFVQHQQPATEPWHPVTDYSFDARTRVEGRHPDVLIETFGKGPFLDYGCGPDAILVRLLRDRGVMAFGIDPILNEQWQCFRPSWDSGPERYVGSFPVVICREVFEHLTVRAIPRTIRRLLEFSPTFIYLTTRFNETPAHVLDIQDHDDLDPTHITLMPKALLRMLFILEGCQSRPDLEERLDWQQKGRCLVFEVSG